MIANPDLIALGANPVMALVAFAKLALGLMAVSLGLIGRRRAWQRAALGLAGLGAIFLPLPGAG
jgi:hypothetical protein